MMFNEIIKDISWSGTTLTLKTGKIARQAHGAVLASMGNTVVLCTVVSSKLNEYPGFLPLIVNYREMLFAAKRIPGGFIKREGKASDQETLISRIIDRSIRPLFPKNFSYDTQVICSVLSYEAKYSPDIVAMIGTSAALSISGIPIKEIFASARVGYVNNKFVLNPSLKEKGSMDLLVSSSENSIIMIESEIKEIKDQVIVDALNFAQESIKPVLSLIQDFKKSAKIKYFPVEKNNQTKLVKEIKSKFLSKIEKTFAKKSKRNKEIESANLLLEIKNSLMSEINQEQDIDAAFDQIKSDIVRQQIIKGKRTDKRKLTQIRKIESEISLLPTTHGSALFTRGETQSLATVTLGSTNDAQIVDDLYGLRKENFILHYTFPPYAVCEVGQLKPPGRREIGHGKLALKALNAVMPNEKDFPYITRLVSEITESNGSSSMATICSGSLALISAGVPIKTLVAGIAMGLIKQNEKYYVLSDITEEEDHLGDMDFKISGTNNGITALQMDTKVLGINSEVIEQTIKQARKGITSILSYMDSVIQDKKANSALNSPIFRSIKINPKGIKALIGINGKIINNISETTGTKISIADDGVIRISGYNEAKVEQSIKMINATQFVPKAGVIMPTKVVKVTNNGIIVSFNEDEEGFINITDMPEHAILNAFQEGETIKAKVINIDSKNKVSFSLILHDELSKQNKEAPKKIVIERKFFN